MKFLRSKPAIRVWALLFLNAGLISTHVWLAAEAALHDSVTVNEFAHLPAGITYWQTGYFGAYYVNPPVAKLWFSSWVAWDSVDLSEFAKPSDNGLELGRRFMEAVEGHYHSTFYLSRLLVILLSVIGGGIVYCWSAQLFGTIGGTLSLFLWCFSPNVLAHAHLASPDLPATVFAVLASYSYWRFYVHPGWSSAFITGGLLGIAVTTKFSLVILYPAFAILFIVMLIERPVHCAQRSIGRRCWQMFFFAIVIFIASLIMINSVYLFTGTCKRISQFDFRSQTGESIKQLFLDSGLDPPVPFPNEFVNGIDAQKRHTEGVHRGYLLGEWKWGGWWYYYLLGLIVKMPVGTVLLVGGAVFYGAASRRCSLASFSALILPPVLLFILVSSHVGMNQHVRYVLPALPYAFILIGGLTVGVNSFPSTGKYYVSEWLLGLCCLAIMAETLLVHPHHLSFFNVVAGGPTKGHKWLLDSNIDYGQDLRYLQEWLEDHDVNTSIGLAHYGYVSPHIYGVQYRIPPYGPSGDRIVDQRLKKHLGPQPGWYAISVSVLHGKSCTMLGPDGEYHQHPPDAFAYFREFEPVGKAGYSINIYHIREHRNP